MTEGPKSRKRPKEESTKRIPKWACFGYRKRPRAGPTSSLESSTGRSQSGIGSEFAAGSVGRVSEIIQLGEELLRLALEEVHVCQEGRHSSCPREFVS